MTPRVVQYTGQQMHTGVVQFGDERPGVFIDNDQAIIWAADLRVIEVMAHNASWGRKEKIMELVRLLESVK